MCEKHENDNRFSHNKFCNKSVFDSVDFPSKKVAYPFTSSLAKGFLICTASHGPLAYRREKSGFFSWILIVVYWNRSTNQRNAKHIAMFLYCLFMCVSNTHSSSPLFFLVFFSVLAFMTHVACNGAITCVSREACTHTWKIYRFHAVLQPLNEFDLL